MSDQLPTITRLVACSTLELGLYGYCLYVDGERMHSVVLDTTLTHGEVDDMRATEVDLENHPNRVFLRSLQHLPQYGKTS